MKLEEPELLADFLGEQKQYSADFKALVLRLYKSNGGDITRPCALSNIFEQTLCLWISAWNQASGGAKKKSRKSSGLGGLSYQGVRSVVC